MQQVQTYKRFPKLPDFGLKAHYGATVVYIHDKCWGTLFIILILELYSKQEFPVMSD